MCQSLRHANVVRSLAYEVHTLDDSDAVAAAPRSYSLVRGWVHGARLSGGAHLYSMLTGGCTATNSCSTPPWHRLHCWCLCTALMLDTPLAPRSCLTPPSTHTYLPPPSPPHPPPG